MNTQVHQAFRRPKCNEFCGRIITAVSNIGRLDDRVNNSLSLLSSEIVRLYFIISNAKKHITISCYLLGDAWRSCPNIVEIIPVNYLLDGHQLAFPMLYRAVFSSVSNFSLILFD